MSRSPLLRHTWLLLYAAIANLIVTTQVDAQLVDAHFIEGFSQPNRISNVAANATGTVKEVVATEGKRVSKGDCLVKLDDSVQQELIRIAELSKDALGELQAAQAELKGNTRRVEIIRELAKRGSSTPEELIRAENDFLLSKANVTAIQEKLLIRAAEHRKLLVETKNYCIEAPFDGVLIEVQKELGEYVGPSDPVVCVVAELEQLSVEFFVPVTLKTGIEIGSQMEVVFAESGRSVLGTVYYVSPFPNGETSTYRVKLRVDNSDGSLNAGERCQLERSVNSDLGVVKQHTGNTNRASNTKPYVSQSASR